MKKYILIVLITLNFSVKLAYASIDKEVNEQRFENQKEYIYDRFSEIWWQDTGDNTKLELEFVDAKIYCKELSVATKKDWRLPSIEEVNSAKGLAKHFKHVKRYYKNNSSHDYWSSTFDPKKSKRDNDKPYYYTYEHYLNSKMGMNIESRWTSNYYVRCVRSDNNYSLSTLEQNIQKLTFKRSLQKFKVAQEMDKVDSYISYIEKYPNAYHRYDAINKLERLYSSNFSRAKAVNSIESYTQFIDENPESKLKKNAQNEIVIIKFEQAKKKNNINKFQEFIEENINSKEAEIAIAKIFTLVKSKNSISGYNWFINNYPFSKKSRQALINMHLLAFQLAKDINTINAYNDFVIAYPTAKQVKEANETAYKLEKSEYVGMLSFFNEEKDARRLLVQSKILEQSAEDLSNDEKVGYMMVVNRMNDLLKQEFNSTDAALRHLESNEFKNFVRFFKRSMKDLKRQITLIADNTSDLSSIMKNQSTMMNSHFENAAQDRDMASELTKQHRHWERFIGEVGQ